MIERAAQPETRADLISAMRDNYVAYFRQFAALPGVHLHEERDLVWFVAAGAPGQYVLRTQFPADDARARIAATLSTLEQLTDRLRWLVFETSQPADLPSLLTEAGLYHETGEPWMAARLAQIVPAPDAPSDFQVMRVYDQRSLEDWMLISAAGYGMSIKTARIWFEAYLDQGFALDARSIHFVGYLGKEPATTATLLLSEGMAGIFDVATPPRLRRLGLAGTVTHVAMSLARAWGYRHACLQSSAMGENLYRSLGFETVFFERAFSWSRT